MIGWRSGNTSMRCGAGSDKWDSLVARKAAKRDCPAFRGRRPHSTGPRSGGAASIAPVAGEHEEAVGGHDDPGRDWTVRKRWTVPVNPAGISGDVWLVPTPGRHVVVGVAIEDLEPVPADGQRQRIAPARCLSQAGDRDHVARHALAPALDGEHAVVVVDVVRVAAVAAERRMA